MIRSIESSEAAQATQPKRVAPSTPAGKTFASHLIREKTATGGAAADAHAKEALQAPEGEVWTPVKGHDHYARITDGPRAGLYVNLSRGDRRGQTFRVETRDGQRVHIYGEGTDEKVVVAVKDSGRVKRGTDVAGAANRPKGEEWAPVEGANNYADILSGPRNGLYVNTSGGIRDGMAFRIVTHGERTFHVYGKGKHRQMIEVGVHKTARNDDSAATGGNDATTGGKGADSATTGGAAPAEGSGGGTPGAS